MPNKNEKVIQGRFSLPKFIGKGINVENDQKRISMTEHKIYRSAQLYEQLRLEDKKEDFVYTVKVGGIHGGWLYLGVSKKFLNFNVSCFYDIDKSFGFGLSSREIVVESYK